jgi:hypothetical protein
MFIHPQVVARDPRRIKDELRLHPRRVIRRAFLRSEIAHRAPQARRCGLRAQLRVELTGDVPNLQVNRLRVNGKSATMNDAQYLVLVQLIAGLHAR